MHSVSWEESLAKSFPLDIGFYCVKGSRCISKRFFFLAPSPAIVRKGYFSDLYLENLMGLLEVKFMNMGCGRVPEGSSQDCGFRSSLSHTQSPAIHQNDHLHASPKM